MGTSDMTPYAYVNIIIFRRGSEGRHRRASELEGSEILRVLVPLYILQRNSS